MLYYELFQTREGKITYGALFVMTIVLFIIDKVIEKKRNKLDEL
ncbi:hypothetical protein Cpap_3973 [Ruminiclostridium papyrosolvens DSM 2782]|uniref:Uncharacterized protein n=1 Tax=Ruminiclostridium papyrosolvens DSM 2782 TaxID=588581 RepID=F1T7T9_9FIRM|nr:hypothetical protein [Ruminiclostridium papyrosolvens]EGD49537.1 hypothetical protein Cpap_3973 [Ruminiclostridium papyrosolvens DSM 2782]WES33339.1 hypothetical protein P0092_16440 [Ruminiclostridium papyrosolvens DSM 2782]